MNKNAKTFQELLDFFYNRIKTGILYSTYAGKSTPADIKKHSLSSITLFYNQLEEEMDEKEFNKRLFSDYKLIFPKAAEHTVSNQLLAKSITEQLDKKTDLFERTIKPSLTGLTELEAKTLAFLCTELADWRFSEPTYSCVGGDDVTKHFKWKGKTTSGIISSLTQKGFLDVGEKGQDFEGIIYPQWHMIPKTFPEKLTVAAALNPAIHLIPVKKSPKKSKAEEITKKTLVTVEAVVKEKKETVKKDKKAKTKPVSSIVEISSGTTKFKPFAKFGLHGKNVEVDGFKAGDSVEFLIKDKKCVGEYVHFHINNHSPKGYYVIRYEGKLYERVTISKK